MTESFTEILKLGFYVSHTINACFIVCCIYVSYCAWKNTDVFKRKIIYISAIITLIIAQVLFEVWWYKLNNSAASHEDRKWLLDHDGGGLIALFVINCFKAIICGVTSYFVSNAIIKKRRGLQEQPSSEEL